MRYIQGVVFMHYKMKQTLCISKSCYAWGSNVISQTLKHVWDIFDFNMISNLCGYLALFVPKTLSVAWYFIMDLISSKVHGYFALFKSKSVVIFICFHCLITFFKLCKFTWTLCRVFFSPNLNFYVVFHYWNTCLEICFSYSFCYFIYLRLVITL